MCTNVHNMYKLVHVHNMYSPFCVLLLCTYMPFPKSIKADVCELNSSIISLHFSIIFLVFTMEDIINSISIEWHQKPPQPGVSMLAILGWNSVPKMALVMAWSVIFACSNTCKWYQKEICQGRFTFSIATRVVAAFVNKYNEQHAKRTLELKAAQAAHQELTVLISTKTAVPLVPSLFNLCERKAKFLLTQDTEHALKHALKNPQKRTTEKELELSSWVRSSSCTQEESSTGFY